MRSATTTPRDHMATPRRLAPLEVGHIPAPPTWGSPLPMDPPKFYAKFAEETRARTAWVTTVGQDSDSDNDDEGDAQQHDDAASGTGSTASSRHDMLLVPMEILGASANQFFSSGRDLILRGGRDASKSSVLSPSAAGFASANELVPPLRLPSQLEEPSDDRPPPAVAVRMLAPPGSRIASQDSINHNPPSKAAPDPNDPAAPEAVTVEDIQARLEKSPEYARRYKANDGQLCNNSESMFSIDPNGKFSSTWDSVLLILLAYVSIWAPVEISFFGDGVVLGVTILNYMVDLMFACDMVINSCMMYWDQDNKPVASWPRTAWRYARTWFIPDLLSTFPFANVVEWSTSSDGSQLRTLRLVRLVRLIKLARLLRASRLMRRFEAKTSISYSGQSIVKYAILMLVVVHWSACLVHMTPVLESLDDNWITTAGLGNGTVSDLYAASIMIGVIALPVGVPQVELPVTSAERAVTILMVLAAGSAFAFAIGQTSNLIMNMDPATSQFQTSVDTANQFIVDNQISGQLASDMREYLHVSRPLFRSKFFSKVLRCMTPTLQQDVACHMHGKWLLTIPFFRAPNETERNQFIAAVAKSLRQVLFTPRELVIHNGEPSDTMYVVKSGLLARLGCVFGAGRYVGEDVILRSSRRRYFVRALTYASLQMLTRDDLFHILETGDFVQTRLLIKKAAVRLALRREMTRMADVLRVAKLAEQMGKNVSSKKVLEQMLSSQRLTRSIHFRVGATNAELGGTDARDTEAAVPAAHYDTLLDMEIKVERAALAVGRLRDNMLRAIANRRRSSRSMHDSQNQ